MMIEKYQNFNIRIPIDKRDEINQKILWVVGDDSLRSGLTAEDIFNGYTGIGGLHGLSRADFENYHEYSEEKKLAEIGQFFTPPDICKEIVRLVEPSKSDLIADLCCGKGNFFNYIPFEGNAYGCDIDMAAVKVAKYLYPEAHIQDCDIQNYSPDVKFDIVFGNPPFNLKMGGIQSQFYFFKKAHELMKPGGICLVIVPLSFLSDDFFCKSQIDEIDLMFNFIVQFKLPADSFKVFGVDSFETKVMVFQKKSLHLQERAYNSKDFARYDIETISRDIIKPVLKKKDELKWKLLLEFQRAKGNHCFDYKVCKFLYQIRTHKKTAPFYNKCLDYIEKFKTQEKPEKMSFQEWDRVKITENRVLSYLKKTLRRQNQLEMDKIELVKTRYGFKLKAYSPKSQALLNKYSGDKSWKIHDLVLGNLPYINVPGYPVDTKLMEHIYRIKREKYSLQSESFKSMSRDPLIDRYLDDFVFIGRNGEDARFNPKQKIDLGLIFRKDYSLLNWQQGSGKTPASYAWAKYIQLNRSARNIFVVASAIAISMTWAPFLSKHGESYIYIKSKSDINSIRRGDFVILSLEMVVKHQRLLKAYIKRQSQKVALIFDESDGATNHLSKRSKAVLNCFRKTRFKLEMTGTTTRNNINELYTQFEILYNNSFNMICECRTIHREVKKDGEVFIESYENKDYFMKPFSARRGNNLFRACFNPGKTTVFGIKKHNQDIFNTDELIQLIEKTIITRKFKEIVGEDKYSIQSHWIRQNKSEEHVYGKIVHDFNELIPQYFKNTGNSRKESLLRIIRQIQLMIKATSMPQSFKEYSQSSQLSLFSAWGFEMPVKCKKIQEMIRSFSGKRITVGTVSHEALDFYFNKLSSEFPERAVFKCSGLNGFKARLKMINDFQATADGILVCTQQSLENSVNIPECNEIIIECLQWNIPRIEQFYFRFIRYDSPFHSNIHFINYKNTIEVNIMALLMVKERLNEFIKTLEVKEDSDIFEEFDLDPNLIESIIRKVKDSEGKTYLNWGAQSFN